MTTQEKIEELSIRFMQAWKAKNEEELKEITSEDFIMFSRLGAKNGITSRTMFLQMVTKLYQLLSFEYQFVQFVYSEHLIVVSSILTMQMTQGGVEGTEETKYLITDVWRNEKGTCRMIYRHVSPSSLLV